MKELVSIIMPVYNSEKYIDEAIESVLSQTYRNWELLIIDDHSTDASVDRIRHYADMDSRIVFLQTGQPSGAPAEPRNIGIARAKGRFIAFLDSDDVWLPSKLELQLPWFEDSSVAVVYSDYEKLAEEGTRSGRVVRAPLYTNYRKLLRGNVIGNVTGIYDTSKVGKVFFQKVHHEDYVLWLQLLKQGFLARNVGCVAALYRLRRSSVSSNKLKTLSWQWNIYRNIEHIPVLQSTYFFICYAVKALLKSFK